MHPSLETIPGETPVATIVRDRMTQIRISLIDCGLERSPMVAMGTFYRRPGGGWLPDVRRRAVLKSREIDAVVRVLQATRTRLRAQAERNGRTPAADPSQP